jgi:bifunctional non-homologous end joining protein LigD
MSADDLSKSRYDRMVYYAFDLLYLDGFDLRGAPLVERKRVLEELLKKRATSVLRFSAHTLKMTQR